jgi:hypothetical protein
MSREAVAAALAAYDMASGGNQAAKSFQGDGSGDIFNYRQKHDVSGSLATAYYGPGFMHGPNGLLTFPGIEPDVYSTMTTARGDLMGEIPWRANRSMYPMYEILTSMSGDSGTEKTAVCDPPKIGGLIAAGKITAPFGRVTRGTRPIDIVRLGQMVDRSDPMDLRLMNAPGVSYNAMGITPNTPSLVNEMQNAEFSKSVSLAQSIATQLFSGSPANNTGEGYMEFKGLQVLVNTGYRDAETGNTLPTVDSLVYDMNHLDIDGLISATNQTNVATLMDTMRVMLRELMSRADLMGLSPVRWQIVMRENLFYALTAVWPCNYLAGGCVTDSTTGRVININASDTINMRDGMRREKYLIIDGVRWQVGFDRTPEETGNNSGGNFPRGCFESDIYIVPMSAQGRATLYGEYFPFDNPQIQAALAIPGVIGAASNNGQFLTIVNQTRTCITLETTFMGRLVLRTPWLAGRLSNIVYCPAIHGYDSFPDDPYAPSTTGSQFYRVGPSYDIRPTS